MRILSLTQGHTDNLGDQVISLVVGDYYRSLGHEVICGKFYPTRQERIAEIKDKISTDAFSQRVENPIKKFLKRSKIIVSIYEKVSAQRNSINVRKRVLPEYACQVLQDIDLIIIGGGQLIKHNHDFIWCMDYWCRKTSCPVIVLGVGADMDLSAREKRVYSRALKNAKKIIVRDYESQQLLSDMGVDCSVAPDVAFLYSSLSKYVPKSEKKYDVCIDCFPRPKDLDKDDYYKHIIGMIKGLEFKAERIGLIYSTYCDYEDNLELLEYAKQQTRDLEIELCNTDTVEELLDVIGSAECTISARMHILILAKQYGKKTQIIPISQKLKSFETLYQDIAFDMDLIIKKTMESLTGAIQDFI